MLSVERLREQIEAGEVDETAWRDDEQRDAWQRERTEGEIVHDVCKWLSRVTLDIIGDGALFVPRVHLLPLT